MDARGTALPPAFPPTIKLVEPSKDAGSYVLIKSLQLARERVLLRVGESPGAQIIREFTGNDLIDAKNTARSQPISSDSQIVLLLLPHSPELFLLQIGLTLCGKVPAVLPWPTTRVDGLKYQRNLLHQLNQLPADHLITLPRALSRRRSGGHSVGDVTSNHVALIRDTTDIKEMR